MAESALAGVVGPLSAAVRTWSNAPISVKIQSHPDPRLVTLAGNGLVIWPPEWLTPEDVSRLDFYDPDSWATSEFGSLMSEVFSWCGFIRHRTFKIVTEREDQRRIKAMLALSGLSEYDAQAASSHAVSVPRMLSHVAKEYTLAFEAVEQARVLAGMSERFGTIADVARRTLAHDLVAGTRTSDGRKVLADPNSSLQLIAGWKLELLGFHNDVVGTTKSSGANAALADSNHLFDLVEAAESPLDSFAIAVQLVQKARDHGFFRRKDDPPPDGNDGEGKPRTKSGSDRERDGIRGDALRKFYDPYSAEVASGERDDNGNPVKDEPAEGEIMDGDPGGTPSKRWSDREPPKGARSMSTYRTKPTRPNKIESEQATDERKVAMRAADDVDDRESGVGKTFSEDVSCSISICRPQFGIGRRTNTAYDPRDRRIAVEESFRRSMIRNQVRMREAFAANVRSKNTPYLKRGRINGTSLARTEVGFDRVFRRMDKAQRKSHFVCIGVDLSGSTSGGVDQFLVNLAVAQGDMLHSLGVPFAVFGHSGRYRSDRSGKYVAIMQLMKAPHENWIEARTRAKAFDAMSMNLDGTTLRFYRELCDRQGETDRWIVYYTDGSLPAEDNSNQRRILMQEVNLLRGSVERRDHRNHLIAVACGTDEPKSYGMDTISVAYGKLEKSVDEVVDGLVERLTDPTNPRFLHPERYRH